MFIDAIRGLAALAVLFTHALDMAIAEVHGGPLTSNPFVWRLVRSLFGHGAFFVWTFFVLSGYCIHQSIARGMARGNYSWKKYALARITRIYPLFLIGLMLALAVWFVGVRKAGIELFAWPQFWASLFMLHGFTCPFPCYDQSWSLANEMLYYFVWPAAIIFCRGHGNRAARLAMVWTLAASLAIVVMWRVLHRMESSAAVSGAWTLAVLFPVWIAGAWLCENGTKIGAGLSFKGWLARCIPLSLAPMAILFSVRFSGAGETRTIDVIGLTAIPALLLLVAGGHHFQLSQKAWARPVCRWLGEFSYPCYILHYQVLFLLNHFMLVDVVPHPLVRFAILFGAAFAFSVAVGPTLERKIMRWRKGVLARASAA